MNNTEIFVQAEKLCGGTTLLGNGWHAALNSQTGTKIMNGMAVKRITILLLILMCGIVKSSAYHWMKDFKVGSTFTVTATPHASTYSINWDYDSDVIQPVSSIGQATSSVTFKVIGTTPSAGSIIYAVTYYWVTNVGHTGLYQYADDWRFYVKDETTVKLDKETLELNVGDNGTLTASLSTSASSTKFSWSSSKSSVASVSGSGAKATVKAKANGRATVKVTLDNGNYAECEVIVGGAPDPKKFTVTANPRGGIVRQGTIVKLTSSIEDATIYYTTDGSTPTQESNYYLPQVGVTLKESCTLKAIAKKWQYPNDKYSEIMTETYTMKEEPGYIFTAKTPEGIDMKFQVVSTSPKECKVSPENANNYRYSISTTTKGTVTIPSTANGYTVVGICEQAFCSCSQLTKVIIPNTVKTIDADAFSGCSNLKNLVLPNNLTTIGKNAFSYCTSLTSIIIPSNVSSIGKSPFFSCSGLTELVVADGNPYYDSREGCNAIIKTATNTLIQGIDNTIIPESVTSIGVHAFAYCQFTSMKIPRKVTHIETYAFQVCRKLESLTLGESIKSIGSNAFNCSSLVQVVSNIEVPFAISSDVFSNASAATLYVPQGTKEKYENCNGWKSFKEIIEMGDKPSDNTDIVVTATSCSRKYGEPNPVFGYVVSGGAIHGVPEISCNASETSEIGTYTISISKGTISEKVRFVNGVLTIEKAPLVISANNYTIKTGENLPEFKASYDGFKNGETESVLTKKPVLTCSAINASAPGAYEINISGAEAKNYSIKYMCGTLTIVSDNSSEGLSVTTLTGGTLSEKIGNNVWNSVKRLCISGPINGTDICLIRKMLQEGKLEELNLRDAQIVSGGESYDKYGLAKTSENVIGESMFDNCINLKKIELPSSIQRINDYAFFGCSDLQELVLPESCIAIGDYAIAFCYSLTNMKLPACLSRIGESAFTYSTSLSVIYSPIENMNDIVSPDYYSSPFEGIADNCLWHVPTGTKDQYTTLSWWGRGWDIIDDVILPDVAIEKVTVNGPEKDAWYTLRGTKINGVPTVPGIYIHIGKKVVIR